MSIRSTSPCDHETPSAGAAAYAPGKPLTVSVRRAGELLGLGHTTTWRLISEKKLDTFRVGTKRLVTVNSIERLIADGLAASRRGAACLALIFELLEGGRAAVGEVATGRALGWADYLRSHANRLYAAGDTMVETGAKLIVERRHL